MGLKMWGWLGWLITFNFVNIAWVFFRAKDWEMAEKVLGGMVGLGGVVLPEKLAGKLAFLSGYGVEFGGFLSSIAGTKETPFLIMGALVIVIVMRNSMNYANKLVLNRLMVLATVAMLFSGIMNLAKVSEFLYFNF